MRWLNALERRFGHLAVPGLLRIVVAFNLLVYLLIKTQPGFGEMLQLRPEKIWEGQVWRLFSYVFIPQVNMGSQYEFIWMFMYLNFLWFLGDGLEQAWGSFRLNVYYFLGMLGTTIAVFLIHAPEITGFYLNLSLFFAFATLFPDYMVLVMFILPVKVKWLAMLSVGVVFIQMLLGSITEHVAIAVSLANYMIFFAPVWLQNMRERGRVAERQQQFQIAKQAEEEETLHHCKVCGRNENNAPDMEFRVASDGEEYCALHLPSRRGEIEMPPPLPESSEEPASPSPVNPPA